MNDFLDIWKELTSFLFQFLEEKLFNADNSIVCFFSLVNHCLHCYKFTTNKILQLECNLSQDKRRLAGLFNPY